MRGSEFVWITPARWQPRKQDPGWRRAGPLHDRFFALAPRCIL